MYEAIFSYSIRPRYSQKSAVAVEKLPRRLLRASLLRTSKEEYLLKGRFYECLISFTKIFYRGVSEIIQISLE